MNMPMSWLKDYMEIDTSKVAEYSEAMTMSGTIVEGTEALGTDIDKVVVGKLLSVEKHPDSDHLVICQVDVGQEAPLQIVTGAPNVEAGQYVPVALSGSSLPGGVKIKKGKLRGVESDGMLCSVEELGFDRNDYPDAPESGIYVFPEPMTPGSDIKPYFGLNDTVVEYELTSNRPDCQSVIGIARESAITMGVPFHLPEVKLQEKAGGDVHDYISVEIQNPNLCRRYTAKVIKNVRIAPSPRWMRQRLAACGVRPINNIVDITNYIMLEYGQPMHAFDIRHLAGGKIIVRNAEEGEEFVTLDGNTHTLDSSMLVIADAQKAVALAGVMGGENSKVLDDVTTILFESANFDGPNVRITAKKVGLRTDSSAKFEKGLDPNNTLAAINRACQLVEELDAGDVVAGAVDVYPTVRENRILTYDVDWINRFLATDLSEDFMVDVFEKIGCTVDRETHKVVVPTYRDDMEGMADLAEEVARIYGYNNIPISLAGSTERVGGLSPEQTMREKIASALEACGLSQAVIYSFESPSVFDKVLLAPDDPRRHAVTIANPLGEEFSVMRTLMAPGMLNTLSLNYNRRNESAWLYEIGRVYLPKAEITPYSREKDPKGVANLPKEVNTISIGMYGRDVDFYALKGVVEMVFETAGMKDRVEILPVSTEPYLHPGRQAQYVMDGQVIATLGEVHPKAASGYGIDTRVYLAQINLDAVIGAMVADKLYHPLPKYPAITRDIALRVPKHVYVQQIETIIRKDAGELLESCKLFDVYEGAQVGEGYKSVAYTLVFRHKNKTLEDKSVNKVMTQITEQLKNELGAELRK